MKVKWVSKWTVFSFLSAILGFYFFLHYPDMAYWGGLQNGVAKTMAWFWLGIGLAYVFSILSISFMFIKRKEKEPESVNYALNGISLVLALIAIFLTPFTVIAGLSGM